jgi:hypothetical protein
VLRYLLFSIYKHLRETVFDSSVRASNVRTLVLTLDGFVIRTLKLSGDVPPSRSSAIQLLSVS